MKKFDFIDTDAKDDAEPKTDADGKPITPKRKRYTPKGNVSPKVSPKISNKGGPVAHRSPFIQNGTPVNAKSPLSQIKEKM